MANVIKHTHATQVRVSTEIQGEAVVIEVTDNGQGFEVDQTEVGRGLPGMRQRAQMLGAVLSIISEPGRGCRWRLELPILKPSFNDS